MPTDSTDNTENEATDTYQHEAAPIEQQNRYLSLDFIRGLAIFSILIINIQAFGNLFASIFNPTVNGDFSGVNLGTWFFTHIFTEQKFYTIFTMLFGAGVIVMAERASARGLSAARIHYRRSLLLILFGFTHGFFIWYGDILSTYGIYALLVYLLWRKSPRTLMITGLSLILLVALMMVGGSYYIPEEMLAEMQQNFIPGQDIIDKEVVGYLGDWSQNFAQRVEMMKMMLPIILFTGFRIAGGMLIGMALYKWGIINGQKSTAFYKKLVYFCFLPGIAIVAFGAYKLYLFGFQDAKITQMQLGHFNFLGSVLMAIGYIGLFNLIFLSGGFNWLKKKLQAVGQMAFSNYIAQSLICTTIFYGFGFGLFNSLSRFELFLVVIPVLVLQLIWSEWWLVRFHYGPLEWLWRSLTYFKSQPFKR